MALDDVDDNAPNMEFRIKNAKPRDKPGNSVISSNPDDIKLVVEELIPIIFQDLSGNNRTDLGIIIDASDILDVKIWKEILLKRISEIHDPRVLEVLQS